MRRGSRPDAIVAELRRNGRIPVDADPFATCANVRSVIAQLDALAYRTAAILAMYPGASPDDAALAECIAGHRDDHDALCEAVHDRVFERHAHAAGPEAQHRRRGRFSRSAAARNRYDLPSPVQQDKDASLRGYR
ncbi:hypothetical protein [Burkholderia sp. F1]|uniref:hypothetical protein n=1 Tax=Burkholderia sp. F1 TaxID=3366817 RepID=UPI003D74B5F3